MSKRPRPFLLTILDGWGYSENENYNAITAAKKPNFDKLWSNYSHTLIKTSGASVGLPGDQMGNSEVGHLNLGAGRVVYQEFTRVSRAIRTGSFFTNSTLTGAVDQALDHGTAVHIMGLLSPGGVHSHEEHIHAMVQLAVERGVKDVYVHAFLDGRDTPPKSAQTSLRMMEDKFTALGSGRVASIIGRYYSMDRDSRWQRVQACYDLITQGKADFQAVSSEEGLAMAYERDESDEFVRATAIVPPGSTAVKVNDGDVIVFMNYRSDRAREITRPFIDPDFNNFERKVHPKPAVFMSLTEYSKEFDIPVAFPPDRMSNVFGEYLSKLGMRQLRIAETEKYAHVTFFFNGGEEKPFEGEDRILIPSPQVSTYDLQPEMSAADMTQKLVEAIESKKYDVIISNFANPDMVGHTGDFDATVKAIEALDKCIGIVYDAMMKAGGEWIVTADHGNAEKMLGDDTGQAHTAHTVNPVPLIYVGRKTGLADNGVLADVVPTIIDLMDLEIPAEMTGRSLAEDLSLSK